MDFSTTSSQKRDGRETTSIGQCYNYRTHGENEFVSVAFFYTVSAIFRASGARR